MGTRNLTMVIADNKTRIAQYGQWDGYPNGQGTTVLAFCRAHLKTKAGREAFKDRMARCRLLTREELQAIYAAEGIGNWMTPHEARAFREKYPTLDRDMAAEVLDYVWNAKDEVILKDESSFVADSLFCEWAYVVDLDAGTLEVFKGFNTKPLSKGDRFVDVQSDSRPSASGETYYPVRLLKAYKLDDLPSKTMFLAGCMPKVDEE